MNEMAKEKICIHRDVCYVVTTKGICAYERFGECSSHSSAIDTRIPQASGEPMYLISESQINKIVMTCGMREGERLEKLLRSCPVAQQAPELMICPCAEICSDKCGHHIPHEKNTNCDYSSGCDCQKCHTVQEHRDATLIAQEREKWEREHTPKFHSENPDVFSPWYNVEMVAARVESAKRQAREDVLDEPHINQYLERIRKSSVALKDEKLKTIISVALLIAAEHYESLRSEVKK